MKNTELLISFIEYCLKHPEQRFWQALRNWAEVDFVFIGNEEYPEDTYYFNDKTK